MKQTLLTKSFLVNPVSIVLILFLSQSCSDLMGKSLGNVEAMSSVQGTSWKIRNKMLVNLDNYGCNCYSDYDCKNTPGCGNYCLRNRVPIVGVVYNLEQLKNNYCQQIPDYSQSGKD